MPNSSQMKNKDRERNGHIFVVSPSIGRQNFDVDSTFKIE